MINKSFKYRIYPNKDQEQELIQHCGNTRFLWNHMLDLNKKHYKETNEFIFFYDMCYLLPDIKDKIKYMWLEKSYSQSLQVVCKQLDQALKNCFKSNFGFPKFKKKSLSKDSFMIPQNFSCTKVYIKIPKIGSIKYKRSRLLEGQPKNITISKDGDQWYVSICCKLKNHKKYKKTGSKIGLDLGVKRLATTSNNKYKKPFQDEKLINQIKKTQRNLSRKETKSSNFEKNKDILHSINRKLKNKRKDYLHKYSTHLVKSHDLIVVEDLKIKNMTKSAKGTLENPGSMVKQKSGLNRSLLNQALGSLISMLDYKCRFYGKELIKVNPMFTSQTCSSCNKKHKESRRSQSLFKCIFCGFILNADQNASRNILRKGIVSCEIVLPRIIRQGLPELKPA